MKTDLNPIRGSVESLLEEISGYSREHRLSNIESEKVSEVLNVARKALMNARTLSYIELSDLRCLDSNITSGKAVDKLLLALSLLLSALLGLTATLTEEVPGFAKRKH